MSRPSARWHGAWKVPNHPVSCSAQRALFHTLPEQGHHPCRLVPHWGFETPNKEALTILGAAGVRLPARARRGAPQHPPRLWPTAPPGGGPTVPGLCLVGAPAGARASGLLALRSMRFCAHPFHVSLSLNLLAFLSHSSSRDRYRS